uniref:Uncharacterized protein n=1 Tax=Solanum lycopersicum TaxID=4081 RepID=A0A3Q7E950_SOLLC
MAISSKFIGILIVVLISFPSKTKGEYENNNTTMQCGSNSDRQGCKNNKNEALKLKLVAIVSILMTSMIGVCLPLFSHTIPALQRDTNLFVLVKAFASGVILATGYMHVLPDSFDCLISDCLPENPWRKFPFTTFVAMISAILTLSIDSYAMSCFKKKKLENGDGNDGDCVQNNAYIYFF